MSKFITGALLGIAVGLLIAPEKGEETREALAETAGKIKTKFDRITGRAAGRLAAIRESLTQEIEGLSDDVRNRILTILDEEESKATAEKSSNSYSFKDEFKPI